MSMSTLSVHPIKNLHEPQHPSLVIKTFNLLEEEPSPYKINPYLAYHNQGCPYQAQDSDTSPPQNLLQFSWSQDWGRGSLFQAQDGHPWK